MAAVDKAIASVHAAIPTLSVFDGARLLADVPLVSGVTKRIPHGLGRKLRGYLVVRTSTGAALGYLCDEQSTHTDTATYLYLRAEGYSPTVSLIVF
jgi:hypothetical protein